MPWYLIGQFLGAFVGATLAWLVYKLQFDANEDNSGTLNIFSTNPPIKKPVWNMVTEIIATFALVLFLLVDPYGVQPGDLRRRRRGRRRYRPGARWADRLRHQPGP